MSDLLDMVVRADYNRIIFSGVELNTPHSFFFATEHPLFSPHYGKIAQMINATMQQLTDARQYKKTRLYSARSDRRGAHLTAKRGIRDFIRDFGMYNNISMLNLAPNGDLASIMPTVSLSKLVGSMALQHLEAG